MKLLHDFETVMEAEQVRNICLKVKLEVPVYLYILIICRYCTAGKVFWYNQYCKNAVKYYMYLCFRC